METFTLQWPHLPKQPQPLLAIGYSTPTQWFLLHPQQQGEYEPREWSTLSVSCSENPDPRPMPNGNRVFTLKNYSENAGILERLEVAGIIRRTEKTYHQGFVDIPLVEVLLPDDKLIHACASCGAWEELGQPRYMRCSKCKQIYYCSQHCQHADWKRHKELCRALARGDNLQTQNQQRAEMTKFLDQMGFQRFDV